MEVMDDAVGMYIREVLYCGRGWRACVIKETARRHRSVGNVAVIGDPTKGGIAVESVVAVVERRVIDGGLVEIELWWWWWRWGGV